MSVRGAGPRQTRSDAFATGVQGTPSPPRRKALRDAKGPCHRPSAVAVGPGKMNCTGVEWRGESTDGRRTCSHVSLLFQYCKEYCQIGLGLCSWKCASAEIVLLQPKSGTG